MDDDRLAKSFDECAHIVRTRARNFYHGLKLTPEPRRSAIYSIYAWMRAADDEADSPDLAHSPKARHDRLRDFRERTRRVLAGDEPGADWPAFWTAFAASVWSYGVDPAIFNDMLDGLDEDLDHAAYTTERDLERYCYRVAGTAGLACVRIWGLRSGASNADGVRARELALRRGQAFQRTNILRDFAQDYDGSPRRVYLPEDALSRHALTAQRLRDWDNGDACASLVREQAGIARAHYRASDELLDLIDPACAPTLWAMTRIYAGLLSIIERDPRRIVGPRRIRLSGIAKACIAMRAAMVARRARVAHARDGAESA